MISSNIYGNTILLYIFLQLVQQIHAIAYEENEGEKILNENEKFGGKIVREPKRLEMLLAWLNLHFLRADYDPVTLAAIAHYGIVGGSLKWVNLVIFWYFLLIWIPEYRILNTPFQFYAFTNISRIFQI